MGSLRQSFADWLAEDALYENVSLTRTTTRADAIALIETFAPGLDNIAVDMLAIAQDGERVFTERVDYLRKADSTVIATIHLMGIFVIRDGWIAEWCDYFRMLPATEAS
ncbi:limonene-1,2-epoxide hydrolase family protein [Pseudomonas sp. R3.Fl]|uniref:limonene-1,2-epoxide hydrolase family protein n=1 Tax=Pseudomonas sp. R3.Fl TaxID=2928708 RepID=UPI0024C14C07|nr:limonene-1,2-epoxide hydrolase family protein [Pseudomonas sp. R3.Fl]